MDISHKLPNNVAKTPGEYEAVAVLHKALVSLREELNMRDSQIKVLEEKLQKTEKGQFDVHTIKPLKGDSNDSNLGTTAKQLQFDDLFELVEHVEDRSKTCKISFYSNYSE